MNADRSSKFYISDDESSAEPSLASGSSAAGNSDSPTADTSISWLEGEKSSKSRSSSEKTQKCSGTVSTTETRGSGSSDTLGSTETSEGGGKIVDSEASETLRTTASVESYKDTETSEAGTDIVRSEASETLETSAATESSELRKNVSFEAGEDAKTTGTEDAAPENEWDSDTFVAVGMSKAEVEKSLVPGMFRPYYCIKDDQESFVRGPLFIAYSRSDGHEIVHLPVVVEEVSGEETFRIEGCNIAFAGELTFGSLNDLVRSCRIHSYEWPDGTVEAFPIHDF
ncbi:hypothetical protein L596_009021 [Steinernema carpocapsae]|uniref:Uncharacterized protein n=1 Tax=Steinernema carpocapsae TaxID=34508 RepID=A0A4V6A6K5_STECR|nr:hypothetical protein L596_009021 [Steinernema carpocapsae]